MKIDWRHVGISLVLGVVGGLIIGSLLSTLGGSNSEVLATWFSAIGTVAAVIVSLITSRGAMKIARYTGMYEARLNEQIQLLLAKIESLVTNDFIGPKAYTDYKYQPYHIPGLEPAIGEEGKNMDRFNSSYALRNKIVNDVLEIRQKLAAIRMLSNGHLDRETITNDIEMLNSVVTEYDNFEQKMSAKNLNPDHYQHTGTYPWQRYAGRTFQKIFDDFKLLKMTD